MTLRATPLFVGSKAYEYLLKQMAFGPRNPNSTGHANCLSYLTSELRALADRVELQQFTQAGYNQEILRLTNIIASFNIEASSRVLLCAHWDTRPRADNDQDKSRRDTPILGANDGASGVAVLLEVASLLHTQRPAIGVDIVLFDGEDYGLEGDSQNYLLGSRYFARNKKPGYQPRFGVLLDMIGDADLQVPKEGYSMRYAPDVVALVWDIAKELGYMQFVEEVGVDIMDDHLPLNEAGIKTIDIIDFNYPDQSNKFWHTHLDIPENCSSESLEAVGTVITHVIYTQHPQ
jgi:Zn-dependent M28 family amino/carboxypeptidase